ncbi:hypothetical protein PQX77_008662 [Marasmius sp. AFHP31]|nr:hypothetical protein PQX77_008662 [Marasmius sp. AFHP31]
MAEEGLKKLRLEVATAHKFGRVSRRYVLDNTQRYSAVHEGGASRESRLICGTSCTAILMEDCPENAFNLENYLTLVLDNQRAGLTVSKLYASINWTHIRSTQVLHAFHALAHFIPSLKPMLKLISDRFRASNVPHGCAIHRMRDGRKTVVQPLGTNAEKEIETAGMVRALDDFHTQAGSKPEYASSLISWVSGDGGSVLAMKRAKKYLATSYDPEDPHSDYDTLHNLLPTTELWHTQATSLNTIAENHFGPAVSHDPSSLSRCATLVNFKRPTNFRDCSNYYPLSRCLTLIWETQVIDCVRIDHGLSSSKELIRHFEQLERENKLPSFDELLERMEHIVDRYMSSEAYEQALSLEANKVSPPAHCFPTKTTSKSFHGSTLVPPPFENIPPEEGVDIQRGEATVEGAKLVKEKSGFDGDRTLANSILFKMEYSYWLEASYAISEGDVGRVFEIIKIWVFLFAGSSNTNYRDLMLDLWCHFTFECSKELKTAMWNNWLVNLTGEKGNWNPADLVQEHFNRWLEDLVGKSGASFDNSFLRKTISPNVDFFLHLKKQFEIAYDLHKRSNSHTSPHLRDEYNMLLSFFEEEDLHFFVPQRTLGHTAINLLNRGYERFDDGMLDDILRKHTAQVNILRAIDSIRKSTEYTSASSSTLVDRASLEQQTPSLPTSISTPSPSRVPSPSTNSCPHSPAPSTRSSSPTSSTSSKVSGPDGDRPTHDSDETDSDSGDHHSRLKPGPEILPSIDSETGRLVDDWMDDEEIEREIDIEEEELDDALDDSRIASGNEDSGSEISDE